MLPSTSASGAPLKICTGQSDEDSAFMTTA
jgi:hypothetical protein